MTYFTLQAEPIVTVHMLCTVQKKINKKRGSARRVMTFPSSNVFSVCMAFK